MSQSSPVASPTGLSNAPRGVPGWVVVSFVIVLSLALAGIALGYHLFQSSRLIGYFGVTSLQTIRDSTEATLYVQALESDDGGIPVDAIERGGIRWRHFAPGRNEATRPGWTHAKSALLAAESYRWDEFPLAESLSPDAMLVFRHTGKPPDAVVYLDWDAAAIRFADSERGLWMTEQKRDALRTYLLEAP